MRKFPTAHIFTWSFFGHSRRVQAFDQCRVQKWSIRHGRIRENGLRYFFVNKINARSPSRRKMQTTIALASLRFAVLHPRSDNAGSWPWIARCHLRNFPDSVGKNYAMIRSMFTRVISIRGRVAVIWRHFRFSRHVCRNVNQNCVGQD